MSDPPAETPDDPELDEQYEIFCGFADSHGPQTAAQNLRRLRIPDDVIERLVERFERAIIDITDHGDQAYMRKGARFTWYTGPRSGDRCWPPLRDSLSVRAWNETDRQALDDSTNTIVGLLDHPATETFSTKGLALGHVQSGKTTNFTSVIAKAADRGYRFFIVLSGIHNELRRQTQSRLVHDLVQHNPDYWIQLTRPEHDFVPPAGGAAAYFGKYNRQPVLCVVKKNGPVLRKLIRWLEDAELQLRGCPTIVIDDEADQATVATRTINPLIRRLLEQLPKGAYVGYTATPFANLLIDPASANLYPEDFIVDLPKPKEHFGTEVIFGREPLDHEDPEDVDDGYDMVRRVPDDEVPNVRPMSRADTDGFSPDMRGELTQSVIWFWFATATRRVRGNQNPHSTMLIHTSVSVAVHEAFRRPLEELRTAVLAALEGGSEEFERELERTWRRESGAVPADAFGEKPVDYTEVRRALPAAVAETRVILDNSRSEERLDYDSGPVTVIAVGGNTLSRGLTLEGLVVSYFVRSVSAYDTLLQMGRWFGYRHGYGDLPRLWMTDELRRWFRHLATVEAELREDVRRYMTEGLTPLEFAVRIRAHPALRITQAAKMRDAVQVAAAYGGMRIQTRYFYADDRDWLARNQKAARALCAEIAEGGHELSAPRDGGLLWRDVSVDAVLRFLDDYDIHEESMENDSRLLREYISDRNAKSKLEHWNIAIVGNPKSVVGEFTFGEGLAVPKVIRARIEGTPDHAAYIKTLMSRRDAALDLEVDGTGTLTEADIKRERRRQLPDHGLLVLYPIDAESPTRRERREPLDAKDDAIGVGLVFPEPPPNEDSEVYFAADLSKVRDEAGYVEEEDLALLEEP